MRQIQKSHTDPSLSKYAITQHNAADRKRGLARHAPGRQKIRLSQKAESPANKKSRRNLLRISSAPVCPVFRLFSILRALP
ncbi:hypothetical protein CLOM621_05827 [Clostridium sp. M62/1]|nr:hypothetical protein CLOM621_05827 [Clostridium sp. M62/1]